MNKRRLAICLLICLGLAFVGIASYEFLPSQEKNWFEFYVDGKRWTPVARVHGRPDGCDDVVALVKANGIECMPGEGVIGGYFVCAPESYTSRVKSVLRRDADKLLKEVVGLEVRDDDHGEQKGPCGMRFTIIIWDHKSVQGN